MTQPLAEPEIAPSEVEISAVIPCLNEEETLGICIEKAWRCFRDLGIVGEVVVADNGSSDRSAEIARELGARVIDARIPGYGAALTSGVTAARGRVIIIGDADDSYDWLAMAPFLAKINEGYDFVIGNRFSGGIMPGAMPPLHRYLGNPVLSYIARKTVSVDIGDFHCGMRAFTKEAWSRMGLRTTGMEFASEMVINAARHGLRIAEIPIILYPDKRSRPPHLRSFRDGWRHLRFIMTYAPDQVFLAPGFVFMGVGIALQLALVAGPTTVFGFPLGIHFLALACLMTMLGFNLLNLGVLGKVIVGRKYSGMSSRIVSWCMKSFSLETFLLAGGILFIAGLIADVWILQRWLSNIGFSLEDTIHPAFVASSTLLLGLNMMFSAFLLNMLLAEDRAAAT